MKPWQTFAILAALGGHFEPTRPGVCSAPDPDPAPPAGGGPAKPPAPAPAPTPAPAPAKAADEPEDLENQPWFTKRLERARKKQLKDLGFESEDEAKAVREAHEKAQKDAEAAKRAQMTEIERLRADVADRDTRLGATMSENEELKMRMHLSGVFAEKGVKNHAYAHWLITSALANLGDNEELDERAFLDEAMKDPAHAAALGISAPPPPPPTKVPVSTVPRTAPAPTPPPSGSNQNQPPDFRTFTSEQMAAWKRGQGSGLR